LGGKIVTLGGLLSLLIVLAIISPPRFLGAHGRGKAIAAILVLVVFNLATRENSTPEVKSAAADSAPAPSQPAPSRVTDLSEGRVNGELREVVVISAMALFREYERNEVATDLRLKGKIVEIRGTVAGVNKDFLDSVYVNLKTPNEFMSASVRPVDSDIDKIARLVRGQGVAFRCETMQRFMGSPSGKNCALVN
jgi:hypothetical protein